MTMTLEGLATQVLEAVKNGKSVVVEAYPGFGKTKLASILLSRVHRGLVAVRTHNEIYEVFSFLEDRAGVVYAYGRPKLCFRMPSFSYKECRAMRILSRCNTSFTYKDVAWLAATLRKPDDIVEREKKEGRCLYSALRVLAMKSRKVVATYDYIVSNPGILEKRDIVVLDEAHHLLSYTDELVIVLDEATIELLVKSLKKDVETRPLAYSLRSIYRNSASIREFFDKLSTVLSSVSANNEVVELLDQLVSSYYSGKYYVQSNSWYILTETLPKLAKVPNKVMLSIHLPPFFIEGKNTEHVVVEGEPRIDAYIDTSLTTKYTERSDEMYKEYAKRIRELIANDCGNLVVFPSYEVMNSVMQHLEDVKHRVLSAKDKPESLPNGAIIVDVAGGKLSEGVNIANIRRVIMVGMPYPDPTPELNLLAKIYGFDNVYTYLALLRSFQAVGRIRDRGIAYFLDERFQKYVEKIPKWVRVVACI